MKYIKTYEKDYSIRPPQQASYVAILIESFINDLILKYYFTLSSKYIKRKEVEIYRYPFYYYHGKLFPDYVFTLLFENDLLKIHVSPTLKQQNQEFQNIIYFVENIINENNNDIQSIINNLNFENFDIYRGIKKYNL